MSRIFAGSDVCFVQSDGLNKPVKSTASKVGSGALSEK